MDIQKTSREIGLFETALNLSKVCNSTEILEKVGNTFPIPSQSIANNIVDIAKWLLSFSKIKYMFYTPEIALAEIMGKINPSLEIIFTIPCDMDTEVKDRLVNNIPKNISVSILEEPYFPENFLPGNGMCVICGYTGADRAMVFPDTYRMVEHYSDFKGKKAFVPYIKLAKGTRYDGWIELNPQRISVKWRENNDSCANK